MGIEPSRAVDPSSWNVRTHEQYNLGVGVRDTSVQTLGVRSLQVFLKQAENTLYLSGKILVRGLVFPQRSAPALMTQNYCKRTEGKHVLVAFSQGQSPGVTDPAKKNPGSRHERDTL